MKKLFLFTTLMLFAGFSFAGVLVIEGKYQSKNIYVANSISSSGVGFCTTEVTVNGEITSDEWNSSAFEIDLGHYQFDFGTPVTIKIFYKEGCAPKVLNPGVLRPQPTFDTKEIKVESNGMLVWKTTGEQGTLPYFVQQYKWNKWVTVGEVNGIGSPGEHDYSFKTVLTHGENKFRVVQKNQKGKARISQEATINSNTPKLSFVYNKKKKQIEFSSETAYEFYDKFGQITKKGFGSYADVSNLEKDNYYLSYDNSTEELKLK